jgi:hypothetical protein
MSTRNLPGGGGGKGDWCINMTASPSSVSRLSIENGSLYVLQPYRPPWPVTGIALPCCTFMYKYVLKLYDSRKVSIHIFLYLNFFTPKFLLQWHFVKLKLSNIFLTNSYF